MPRAAYEFSEQILNNQHMFSRISQISILQSVVHQQNSTLQIYRKSTQSCSNRPNDSSNFLFLIFIVFSFVASRSYYYYCSSQWFRFQNVRNWQHSSHAVLETSIKKRTGRRTNEKKACTAKKHKN